MSLLSRTRSWLRAVLRRSRMEREMDAELQFHLACRVDDLVSRGVARADAERQARTEFGDPVRWKEAGRDARGLRLLDDFASDTRYGLRLIRRSPLFGAVAVLSIAMGIGINTAVFTLVNDALLKRLGVHDPESVVLFSVGWPTRMAGETFPYPFCQRLAQSTDVLEGVACTAEIRPSLEAGSQAEPVGGELVTGNYFQLLGVRPHMGRLFTPDDDRTPGAHPVVVLSYGYWQRRFGGDPRVVGGTIRINTHAMTIVGVTPPGFHSTQFGFSPEIRVPMSMQAEMHAGPLRLRQTMNWWVQIAARVRQGVDREQMTQRLQARYTSYLADVAARGAPPRLIVQDGSRGASSPEQRRQRPLLILSGLVGIVLLMVCVNIATLLLARATARRQELTVRLSLGATQSRIARQLLVESLMLSAVGGALGFLLSGWMANALLSIAGERPRGVEFDPLVSGFCAGATLLAALFCGVPPAWSAGRAPVAGTFKIKAPQLVAPRPTGRAALVAAQIALSLLLLVAAGLFARTLHNLRHAPFGFDTERLLTVTMNPAYSGYTRERAGVFFQEVTDRVSALPGVESAALAVMPLLGGSEWGGALRIDTGRLFDPGPRRDAVDPGYFRTVGIPLVEGREFTAADRSGAPPVAIVNQSFVRAYLDGGPALGRRIAVGAPAAFPGFTIVGVTLDTRLARVREEATPMWYMPRLQLSPGWSLTPQTLHVRTARDPGAMLAGVREVIGAIDSSVTVLGARTLTDEIDDHLEVERLLATLGAIFGAGAALLASLGLYGVVAYATSARTREIGIRMALGAEAGGILGLFLRQTLKVIAIGLAIGMALVALTVGYLRSVLYGVDPLDWPTVVVASVLVIIVTGVAAFLPALRATRINPVTALQ